MLAHATSVVLLRDCRISRCGRGAALASDASQVAAVGVHVSHVAWAALSALEGSAIIVGSGAQSSVDHARSGVALRCMDAHSQVHASTEGLQSAQVGGTASTQST